jgi:hypothetical protein
MSAAQEVGIDEGSTFLREMEVRASLLPTWAA